LGGRSLSSNLLFEQTLSRARRAKRASREKIHLVKSPGFSSPEVVLAGRKVKPLQQSLGSFVSGQEERLNLSRGDGVDGYYSYLEEWTEDNESQYRVDHLSSPALWQQNSSLSIKRAAQILAEQNRARRKELEERRKNAAGASMKEIKIRPSSKTKAAEESEQETKKEKKMWHSF